MHRKKRRSFFKQGLSAFCWRCVECSLFSLYAGLYGYTFTFLKFFSTSWHPFFTAMPFAICHVSPADLTVFPIFFSFFFFFLFFLFFNILSFPMSDHNKHSNNYHQPNILSSVTWTCMHIAHHFGTLRTVINDEQKLMIS